MILSLSFSTVCVRHANANGYNPQRFGIDQTLVTSIFFFFLFLESHLNFKPYDWQLIILVQIAALALISAVQFFNKALSCGMGGIVMSMSQTQHLFYMIMEVAIEQRIPNGYELVAILCAISGASIIGFAKK